MRVAGARHQAEAELIQGLLLEEGIPSLVRRSGGFDVPDFLASGPRDILVASSGADAAREILGDPRRRASCRRATRRRGCACSRPCSPSWSSCSPPRASSSRSSESRSDLSRPHSRGLTR